MRANVIRKKLRESGWEYIPGKGWVLSKDLVEDSTGEVQYCDLESAYEIECESQLIKHSL